MRRINIAIDEKLLVDARRLSGESTYSRTIERALHEMVQRWKARAIDRLAGSGLWSGNLPGMRADAVSANETGARLRRRGRATSERRR